MKDASYRVCPSCGSEKAKHVGTKNQFRMMVCEICQTLYADRLPDVSESQNYDDYYSEANLQVPEFIKQRLRDLFADFKNYRRTNKWLDVGFGAGTILQIAAQEDWEVFGIEVSEPAIEHGRKLGFDVFHGDLMAAQYPKGSFDIVTASEILEHLSEPQELLAEVARILRPGGLFWATTPSAKGISYRLMGVDWSTIAPPEHIQLFSKKGMRRMLEKAGFSDIELHTHGTNPMEIKNCFRAPKTAGEEFNRVETSYQLNENLESSWHKKKIKGLLNGVLDVMQMGDSLKIHARR